MNRSGAGNSRGRQCQQIDRPRASIIHLESERKTLVRSDAWRTACVWSVRLQDGLATATDGRKVQVRIADGTATLAVTGARTGLSRDEIEYAFRIADAKRLMTRQCANQVVSKPLHFVVEAGVTFEVDVYDGLLEGIVIAEVELVSTEQDFPRPDWLGEEVTGRQDHRKSVMLQARLAAAEGT